MQKQPNKRIVSNSKYACIKSLSFCLSGGVLICGVAVALLLASLPYASYLDAKIEAQARIRQGTPPAYKVDLNLFSISYLDCAEVLCLVFIPILLLGAWLLWMGSRKSWKTVRAMQPINYANTADLPAPDSLVRASSEPVQKQQAVLLRAAMEEQETAAKQLVRPVNGQE